MPSSPAPVAARSGSPRRQRVVARWAHVVAGLALGTYVYAPSAVTDPMQLWLQALVVPAIVVTGVFMWQQGRIRRLLRGSHRAG